MLNYKILCENDDERPIKIDVYDFNRSGNHSLIGTIETNLKEILNKIPQEIINFHQQEKNPKVKIFIHSNSNIKFKVHQFGYFKHKYFKTFRFL